MGSYDSDDTKLLKCHVAKMKVAGFDGALIDRYGDLDRNGDKPINRMRNE